jgi:UDP-N-acetyl-D-galactosamine dehydrogenase
VKHEYGLDIIKALNRKYDAIVLTVSHSEFQTMDWSKVKHDKTVVYDVKGFLNKSSVTARL